VDFSVIVVFSSIASACCKSLLDPDFFCYICNAGDGNAWRTQALGIGSFLAERATCSWLHSCDLAACSSPAEILASLEPPALREIQVCDLGLTVSGCFAPERATACRAGFMSGSDRRCMFDCAAGRTIHGHSGFLGELDIASFFVLVRRSDICPSSIFVSVFVMCALLRRASNGPIEVRDSRRFSASSQAVK